MTVAIRLWLAVVLLAVAAPAKAVDAFAPVAADAVDLDALRWHARPVIVFADTPEDPAFVEQMALLAARWPELAARGVVVITDTDPAAQGAIRQQLRPRGFALVVIDRDGRVAQRKPFPWDVRELGRAIDRMR
ncbi:MAG: DUF4174 domain-containing protein [Pseudomonadota bacterium]|jgi:hypothetical protein